MCFSAAASFAASGGLAAAGMVGVAQKPRRKEWPLALVPFIFAFQQALEGIVWISFQLPAINMLATKGFEFFAFAFWPAFLPWAIWRIETSEKRRQTILPFIVIGVLVGLYALVVILSHDTPVSAVCSSLAYNIPVLSLVYSPLYLLAGFVSCLLSTNRWINIFGITLGISCLAANVVWWQTGASVWCFFAALLSVQIPFILRARHGKYIMQLPKVWRFGARA